MARINIEDSIYKDRRFYDLLLKMGDIDKTYGVLVRTWLVAQKWYLKPERMIPATEWAKQLITEAVIEVGFAERVGDFVRVCGADEQFAWLVQRVEAGKKGGLTRRGIRLSVEESAKRQAARIAVSKAIKRGDLIRPKYCADCGMKSQVQGHHGDYSKPLEVVWLCDSCHDKTHKLIEEAEAKRPLPEAKPPSLSPSLYSAHTSASYTSSSDFNQNPKNKNYIAQLVEQVYLDLYPRKIGKSKGIRHLARVMKAEELPLLEKAIRNYSKFSENKSPEYIKHFSTFASEWRDWIEIPENSNDLDLWMKQKMEEAKKNVQSD